MIIADSSVWIDHFKIADLTLSKALAADDVLMHPYVIGELALGTLKNRQKALANFASYDAPPMATPEDVLLFIEQSGLSNRGIGYVDIHLLASCLLHGDCQLLTRDRRLREAAEQFGIAA